MGGSDAVEDGADEVVDGGPVVGGGFGANAVGDDGADGHGFVAHEAAEPLEGCALHLVVGDFAVAVAEGFDPTVEVWVGQRQTQFAALRAVESYGRDSVATHHIGASDFLYKMLVGIDDVGLGPKGIPAYSVAEGVLHVEI